MCIRWSTRIVALALLFTTAAMSLDARILSQKKRKCVSGGYETFTLFEDDCSGSIYTLYVDCLGNTYFNVPEPRWRAIFATEDRDPFPEHFWEMVEIADFNTPGALTGIHLVNDYGEQI